MSKELVRTLDSTSTWHDILHNPLRMSLEPQLSGRRIQVIGVTGAGKSTFARRLGQELSIPVCELDSLFHKSRAGGALSEDDARRSVQVLVESNDEWILDGIDTPLPLTLWRVITRTVWGKLLPSLLPSPRQKGR
ncbi:hypothetical protein MY4824_009620 [Beauveria thailandica]